MWSTTGDPEDTRDPVSAYKMFASPNIRPYSMTSQESPFYLAINTRKSPDSNKLWYKCQPLGINSLSSIMKSMFQDAEIERHGGTAKVTNHSARKTLVQKLKKSKVQDTDVVQVTGHKSLQSLIDYDEMDEERQQEVSHLLENYVSPAQDKPRQVGQVGQPMNVASSQVASAGFVQRTSVATVTDLGYLAPPGPGQAVDITVPLMSAPAPRRIEDAMQLFPGADISGGAINATINVMKSPAFNPLYKRRAIIDSDSD